MATVEELREIHRRMRLLAEKAGLSLRSGQWRGSGGSVLGDGTGNSVDFQDQRAYQPGDDPRHINWLATSRTDQYVMKLFRQEVSPRVDLLLDVSASMFLTEAKERRTWELVYYCLECTLRWGGHPRVHLLGEEGREWPLERALAHDWPSAANKAASLPDLARRLPLRAGSLRVLVSDLLSETPPEAALPVLSAAKSRLIIFAPFCLEEARPDWSGNVDFEDCELGGRDRRKVDGEILGRYRRAYDTHFELWRAQCARFSASLTRVPAEGDSMAAFGQEAQRL